MEKTKIDRINELARKAKTTGLTPEEKEEQTILRTEYILAFRENLIGTLDNTYVVGPDGVKRKLERREEKNREKTEGK